MLTVGTAAPIALLDVIEAVQAIPTVEDTRPMIALTTFAGDGFVAGGASAEMTTATLQRICEGD